MGRRDTGLVVLLLFVILLLAALAGLTADPDDRADPRASTWVRSEDGAAALYWTLQDLGVQTRRRTSPFLDADSLRGVVAVIAPMVALTEEEAGAAAEFVRGGGTLLYVPGPYETGGALLDTLGVRADWLKGLQVWSADTREARPRPHRWTEGVARVKGFQRVLRDTTSVLRRGRADTLLTVEGQLAGVVWTMGRGRVIAFSDAGPLRNGRLRESGAATVFARVAADAARGDTLWFDEYHHGFDGGGSGMVTGMARHAWRTLPRGLLLQLLVAGALLLWVAGRRFGAPLQPEPVRRRSPLEHVEALAGAYRQAGAKRTARRLLLAGLARRLGRRAPADEAAQAEMLGRMARNSPVAQDAAAQLEKDFKRGADADLVSLARGVDRYLDEVRRP
jgi:hypothetical protein